MKIVLSNHSDLPIYAQIREQIKQQILDGSLQQGTMLPSIRGLARELGVSVITTSRAFSDLEAEGFITSIPGKGSMVRPQNNDLLREQYLRKIEDHLTAAIETAELLELGLEDVSRMLQLLWQ